MHEVAHGEHGGVGVTVGHGVGQLREFGKNVIGMVLTTVPFKTKLAEPEKLLLLVRGPSDCVIHSLKVPSLAGVTGIKLLMVIGVPDDGVTVIS